MSLKTRIGNKLFWTRADISERRKNGTDAEREYIAGMLAKLDDIIADFGQNYPARGKGTTLVKTAQPRRDESDF